MMGNAAGIMQESYRNYAGTLRELCKNYARGRLQIHVEMPECCGNAQKCSRNGTEMM